MKYSAFGKTTYRTSKIIEREKKYTFNKIHTLLIILSSRITRNPEVFQDFFHFYFFSIERSTLHAIQLMTTGLQLRRVLDSHRITTANK